MRLASIDFARALAIICMLAAHLLPNSMLLRAFAAPSFLLLAGLGYEFLIRSRKDICEVIGRSIILYFVPLIIGTLIGISLLNEGVPVSLMAYSFNFFRWNIFQVIAVGYLLGMILRNTNTRILAIIFSFLLSNWESALTTGVFPVLPWISYFIIGQIAYDLRRISKPAIIVLLVISLVPLVVYPADFVASNRTFIPIVIAISSAVLLTLNGAKVIDRYNITIGLGRITFSAYYFITAIIYGMKIFPVSTQFRWALVVGAILFLSLWEILWRRYNYIFGMEWLLREGSKRISAGMHSLDSFIKETLYNSM